MAAIRFAIFVSLVLSQSTAGLRKRRHKAVESGDKENRNTSHCGGGRDRTLCPRSGDNHLSSGGGGSCKFRYTWHGGTGADTGSPVVTSGSCTITPQDLGSGTHTNTRVRAWVRSLAAHDGAEMDDAGHILANQLGGCGTCPMNLFPQNLRINRGSYRMMEQDIYDCVAQGDVTAYLSWKFSYKAPALAHLRPESYMYNATFSGGSCSSMSKVFPNEFWTPSALVAEEPEMQAAESRAKEFEVTMPLGGSPSLSDATALENRNTSHCGGGRDRTLCPRGGDNHLSSGGGGSCKFRYTWHDGTGADTGSPVVTSGSCTITPQDLGRGTHTNTRVRAWVRSLAAHDGAEMDDAGHILANQLGGCGTCPVNLFPQNLRINRGSYRMMEQAIYDCVAQGDVTAYLSWKFSYKAPALAHLRPESYMYNATFSGGSCSSMSKVFPNEFWTPSALVAEEAEEPWMQVSG